VSILAPVRDYIDALVHPAARQDACIAARHRAFIAPRLLGSLAVLAAIPLYLTLRGVPSAAEMAVAAWLVAPLLVACFLSRTGRYEGAHMLSSFALAGAIATLAFNTGGLASFAAAWLVLVPVEAALSGSRRVVAAATVCAAGAALLLWAFGAIAPPAAEWELLVILGLVAAAVCAAGLVTGAEAFRRASAGTPVDDGDGALARYGREVFSRHGRNGAVLSVSPGAETLFGVRTRELLGHGLFDRVHVADRPAYLTALADAAEQETERKIELRVRRDVLGGPGEAGVSFVWVEMRCRPAEAAVEGAQARREVIAVLYDISARKAREAELADARARSDRADAAKNRFVAIMSHELRTPLNVIIGFSEMLAQAGPGPTEEGRREEYARLINESGHHLLSIVNGLLDMSKLEAGRFEITREPFSLPAVIAGCCDLLALKASQAGIGMERRVAAGLPDIPGDKRALRQVLLNLLSNAIKFTERGGRIVVGAHREGRWAVLEVEDTGIGIAAADLARIGDPFFQAGACYDRRHEGTGLGLSIVKGLVRLHGGEIDIRSRPGEGTRVSVRLPLEGAVVPKPAAPAAAAAQPAAEPIVVDHRVKKIA
jgi:cell cycle sensor histidine kinase DivJ